MRYLAIIVLLGCVHHHAAKTVNQKVNYCAPAYMCNSRHILACNHTGGFSKNCAPRTKMLPMTKEFQHLFLDEHNKYRNEIAQGRIFKPAAAMATLEWDQELANLAVFNVKECVVTYEQCLTSERYTNIDQNIGRVVFPKSKFKISKIYDEIKEEIKRFWYEQYHDITQVEIDSYNPTETKLILNFGKMMLDWNNRIGCAAAQFDIGNYIRVLFTCNYARRLFCHKPVFRSGKYAGSNCKTGKNLRYPFLCSTKEYFNVNDYKE